MARALARIPLVWITLLPLAALAQPTTLLWGDTHLHTLNSFDAYLNQNLTADPATAYRYAQGQPVVHPGHRARVRIETPLDFLVIADHAEFLGVMPTIDREGIPREGLGIGDRIRANLTERAIRGVVEDGTGREFFVDLLPEPTSVEEAAKGAPGPGIPNADRISSAVWQEAIETADRFNQPGRFTTLIGWEWSSIPAGANLHRVVFTSADAGVAGQFHPWSSIDSNYPEDLWRWLDETTARTGAEFVAIPHNSNISKGYMFAESTLRGAPYSAELASQRARLEPVAEVTQIKGDSETHPQLSPEDPFADFETYPYYIQRAGSEYRVSPGDYVRSGLLRGLALERAIGTNPYRFGLIGSTDAHTGLASAEEPNFWGKFPTDAVPERKSNRWSGSGPSGWAMSASGLAAVWSEANTREAILDAFRRREVYATSGPRIAVRVFGGWGFRDRDARATDITAVGTQGGVPMGGVLTPRPGRAEPRLLIHALKDPKSAHLDRIQVVKGWIDADGKTHERVFDAAASGDREPAADGRIPPVPDTVDLATAEYSNEHGAPGLATVWRDPAFDPAQAAFYYVRVLEIPTPRHSLYDAVALGLDPAETEEPATLQERAYTSPIWYRPEGS